MAGVGGRTEAAVVGGKVETRGAVETRTRLTLVHVELTQLTAVAR